MASFTPEQFARMGGGTVTDLRFGNSSSVPRQEVEQPQQSQGLFSRIKDSFTKRRENTQQALAADQSFGSKALQAVGQTAGFFGDVAGDTIATAASKLPEPVKDTAKDIGIGVLNTPLGQTGLQAIQGGMEAWESFKEVNPETAGNLEAVLNIGALVPIGKGAQVAGRGALAAGETVVRNAPKAVEGASYLGTKAASGTLKGAGVVASGIGKGVSTAASPVVRGITEASPAAKGIAGKISDIGGNIRRAFQRGGDSISESAAKSSALETATPQLAEAIRTGVDEKILNNISRYDRATPQGSDTVKRYKKVLDIAKGNEGKLGTPERIELPAGEIVDEQVDLLDQKLRTTGTAIGDSVRRLPKDAQVDITPALERLAKVLDDNGVSIGDDMKLDFSGSGKFSKKERDGIRELWNEATKGGTSRSPRNIYDADRLFSKLQRESRLDNIGELYVEVVDEAGKVTSRPLFSVFRDVFSDTLGEISPDIQKLNAEYKKLKRLSEDLEKSLVKSGDFNITKDMDSADFAKTNLRRLSSDAQSAPVYQQIAEMLDKTARELGYEGAKARDVLDFANEMRKLYKGSVPATGFQGLTQGSFTEIPGKLLKAGEPNVADRRRAIEALVDSLQSAE